MTNRPEGAENHHQSEVSNLVEKVLKNKGSSSPYRPLRNKHNEKGEKPKHEERKPLIYDELREAISEIRDFAVKGHFSAKTSYKDFPQEYRNLANACRNALVKILDCEREEVHCTIKYCASERVKSKRNVKLWTFARSYERSGRGTIMGPGKKIVVYKNSTFASIVGCKDAKKNQWGCRRNQCFTCNDLTKWPNYADGKRNWSSYYKAVAIFPLRYESELDGELIDYIVGFLTYDSSIKNVFKDVPSRFSYIGEPESYMMELRKTDVYHIGHAIADAITLATVTGGIFKEGEGVYIK